MKIRPIRTEDDYDKAVERIDSLIDSEEGSDEFDELEVLSVLVQVYEEEHYPIEDVAPQIMLKHIMEWRGLSRKDLEPILGGKGRVSEVLNGKRRLSLNMIINLKTAFGLPADVFIPSIRNEDQIAI